MATSSKNASAAVHDKVKSCYHHLQVFNIAALKLIQAKFCQWNFEDENVMDAWQVDNENYKTYIPGILVCTHIYI